MTSEHLSKTPGPPDPRIIQEDQQRVIVVHIDGEDGHIRSIPAWMLSDPVEIGVPA